MDIKDVVSTLKFVSERIIARSAEQVKPYIPIAAEFYNSLVDRIPVKLPKIDVSAILEDMYGTTDNFSYSTSNESDIKNSNDINVEENLPKINMPEPEVTIKEEPAPTIKKESKPEIKTDEVSEQKLEPIIQESPKSKGSLKLDIETENENVRKTELTAMKRAELMRFAREIGLKPKTTNKKIDLINMILEQESKN